MIYIQSFFIWLYTKSPLICYNRNRVNGLEHCESSILYREGFILCYPSNRFDYQSGFSFAYYIQKRRNGFYAVPPYIIPF